MKLELRIWRQEDAPSVAGYANNEKIAQNLRDVFPYPYGLADAEQFIHSCLKTDQRQALFRAIVADGRAVGGIALTRGEDVYRRSAELGYWLAEEYWGQGLMTEAVERMCATGFRVWDIVRIYACPYARNGASRRVLEKAGFEQEGLLRRSVCKRGRMLDSCVYAKLRPETDAELETERLILRPFAEEDAADLYDYAKDPRVGPPAGWKPHESEAESLEIIRTVFAAPHVFAVVEKDSGRVVGSAGFVGRHRTELPGPDDEIGYALRPDRWGRGYMPEAVRALLHYGFETMGLNTIWCGVYDFNRKSQRVAEKCGFVYRLTDQRWEELAGEEYSELHYALTKAEWEKAR